MTPLLHLNGERLFAHAPVGMLVVSSQEQIIQVNPAFCRLLGYQAEQLIGRLTSVLVYPEDRAIGLIEAQQLAAGLLSEIAVVRRYLRRDGAILRLRTRVTTLRGDDERLEAFLASVEPIDAPTTEAPPPSVDNPEIDAPRQIEQQLTRALAHQHALALCSQELLGAAASPAARQQLLVRALTYVLDASACSRISLWQNVDDVPSGEFTLRVLVEAYAPNQAPAIQPPPEQLSDVPRTIIAALESGRWVGGPVSGQFPAHPHYQRSFEQDGVQSILMVPIILAGSLWGVLSAADRTRPRVWDEPTVQLLRTAAEMLATFQQAWEITRTLREREHFIQRVTETSPALIHVLDLTTLRPVYANRSLAAMLGYPPDAFELIDMQMLSRVVLPEDLERVLAHYNQVIESVDGQVRELELRVRLGDQGERWLQTYDLVFARDPSGQACQILSLVQDVTESKLTAQALAASAARLRALRDALPDLRFVVRSDGTFLEYYAQPHIALLMPPEQFLGRKLEQVLPPAIADRTYRAFAHVRETGAIDMFEYSLQFDDHEMIFEARVVLITRDELLVLVRDITERQRITQELRRAKEVAEAADRTKSTFLAHVSHEIRTPLTAVIGMASLLRDTDLSPRQQEYVSTIHTGAETLLTIIGNILDLSKIEAGQMELNLQPFNLRTCLKETLDLVAHQAGRKGLSLEQVVDPAVPDLLVGDVARLRQVLVNLLGNAVKFTESGTVSLSVSGSPLVGSSYQLTLSIRDTGIGIASDRLQEIFDPFVQADSTTMRRFGGTGLGLAISKQLVELMGGRITVVSSPGLGSSFTFRLPMSIAPEAAPPARPVVEDLRAPGQLRVLLAEDNLINQEVLRRLIEGLGHRVDVVGDGVEAVAAVTQWRYDVVLMDIQMPEMDGETATRHIRALEGQAQPYIIALTASAFQGDRERYLAAGMDDYVSKPVQRQDLHAILGRAQTRPALGPDRRQ